MTTGFVPDPSPSPQQQMVPGFKPDAQPQAQQTPVPGFKPDNAPKPAQQPNQDPANFRKWLTGGGLYGQNPGVNVMQDFSTPFTKFGAGGIRPQFKSIVQQLVNQGNSLGVYDFDKGHHYAPNDPHLDGRAMDVDTVNKEPVGTRLSPNLGQFINQALQADPRVRLGVPKEIYNQLGSLTGNGRIFVDAPAHIHVEFDPMSAAPGKAPAVKGFTPDQPKPAWLGKPAEAGVGEALGGILQKVGGAVEEAGKGFFKQVHYAQGHPLETYPDLEGVLQRAVTGYMSKQSPGQIPMPTGVAIGQAIYDAFHPHSAEVGKRDDDTAIRGLFEPFGIKEAAEGTWAHFGQAIAAQSATDPFTYLFPMLRGGAAISDMSKIAEGAEGVPEIGQIISGKQGVLQKLGNTAVGKFVNHYFGVRPELDDYLEQHAKDARMIIEHSANAHLDPLRVADEQTLAAHEGELRNVGGEPRVPPGVRIEHQFDGRHYSSQAYDANGNHLGNLSVDTKAGPNPGAKVPRAPGDSTDEVDIHVNPDSQRKGVGTALFDKAEQHLGRPIRPDANRTEAGEGFISSRQGQRSAPGGINVFRYQNTPGEALGSDLRGGTFYGMGKAKGEGDYYKTEDYAKNFGDPSWGGEHLVEDSFNPKNPLKLPAQAGHVGMKTIIALKGPQFAEDLMKWLHETATKGGGETPPAEVEKFLRGIGMAPKTGPFWGGLEDDVTPLNKLVNDSNSRLGIIMDRLGSEAAKAAGHDAIIAPFDKVKFPEHPDEFVDLGAPRSSAGSGLPEAVKQRYLQEPYVYGNQEMREQAKAMGYHPTPEEEATPPKGLLNYNLREDYQTLIKPPPGTTEEDVFQRISGGKASGDPNAGFEKEHKGDTPLGEDQYEITANRLKLGRNLIRRRMVDQRTEQYLDQYGGWKPNGQQLAFKAVNDSYKQKYGEIPQNVNPIQALSSRAFKISTPVGDWFNKLSKEAIKAFPFPHAIGNVGQLAWNKGGWTAVGKAMNYAVRGLSDDQVERLKSLGLWAEYLGKDVTSPWRSKPLSYLGGKAVDKWIDYSTQVLNRLEAGFRQGLLDLADHQHGFDPKNLQNEYKKGKDVLDAMGDYANVSKVVATLQGVMGAPFVAFGLSIVPKALAKAVREHPDRLAGNARMNQDLQHERGGPMPAGTRLGGGPNEAFARMVTDPVGFMESPSRIGPAAIPLQIEERVRHGEPVDPKQLGGQVMQSYGGPVLNTISTGMGLAHQAPAGQQLRSALLDWMTGRFIQAQPSQRSEDYYNKTEESGAYPKRIHHHRF